MTTFCYCDDIRGKFVTSFGTTFSDPPSFLALMITTQVDCICNSLCAQVCLGRDRLKKKINDDKCFFLKTLVGGSQHYDFSLSRLSFHSAELLSPYLSWSSLASGLSDCSLQVLLSMAAGQLLTRLVTYPFLSWLGPFFLPRFPASLCLYR